MADADELFTVKNNFWVGNYQEAIDEAKTLRIRADAARTERDILIYRSYIGLKNYRVPLTEITETAAPALRATRILAQYISSSGDKRAAAATAIADMVIDPTAADPAVITIAATIFLAEGNYVAALKALKNSTVLEHLALSAHALIRMDRLDLAGATIQQMQSIDDEAAITGLTAGLYYLSVGESKIKDAQLTFKEVLDRYGKSNAALNGLATAYIACKRFDDAERVLAEALENNPDDADTIVNVITLQVQSGQLGKKFNDNLTKLRSIAPEHAYVTALTRAEDMFDRVAAKYAV